MREAASDEQRAALDVIESHRRRSAQGTGCAMVLTTQLGIRRLMMYGGTHTVVGSFRLRLETMRYGGPEVQRSIPAESGSWQEVFPGRNRQSEWRARG